MLHKVKLLHSSQVDDSCNAMLPNLHALNVGPDASKLPRCEGTPADVFGNEDLRELIKRQLILSDISETHPLRAIDIWIRSCIDAKLPARLAERKAAFPLRPDLGRLSQSFLTNCADSLVSIIEAYEFNKVAISNILHDDEDNSKWRVHIKTVLWVAKQIVYPDSKKSIDLAECSTILINLLEDPEVSWRTAKATATAEQYDIYPIIFLAYFLIHSMRYPTTPMGAIGSVREYVMQHSFRNPADHTHAKFNLSEIAYYFIDDTTDMAYTLSSVFMHPKIQNASMEQLRFTKTYFAIRYGLLRYQSYYDEMRRPKYHEQTLRFTFPGIALELLNLSYMTHTNQAIWFKDEKELTDDHLAAITSFYEDVDVGRWNPVALISARNMFAGAVNFTGKGLEQWGLEKHKGCREMPSLESCYKMFYKCANLKCTWVWHLPNIKCLSLMFWGCERLLEDAESIRNLRKWRINTYYYNILSVLQIEDAVFDIFGFLLPKQLSEDELAVDSQETTSEDEFAVDSQETTSEDEFANIQKKYKKAASIIQAWISQPDLFGDTTGSHAQPPFSSSSEEDSDQDSG